MRRRTHLAIGGLAFIVYGSLLGQFVEIQPGLLLGGFFAALLGSVVPDLLEPARHGNHRGIAHSRWAGKASALAFTLAAFPGIFQPFVPAPSLPFLLSGLFLGYTLHLFADSLTPAGLPG